MSVFRSPRPPHISARFAFAMLAVLSFTGARPAQAQLAIDRGEMFLEPSGDATKRAGVLLVRNTSSERLQGQVTLEDWDRSADGANRFHKYKTLPHSCGDALRAFPMTLNLAPGEAQPVRIEYTGSDLASECTSLVVVEEARASAAKSTGVTVTMRMGLKVYVTPATAAPGGDVSDFVVTPAAAPGDSVRVSVAFRNEGARHLQAEGHVEVRGEDNTLHATVPLPKVYALAGATMRTRAALPVLSPGKYILLAIFDFGGADLAAAQLEYEVKR